MNVRRHKSFRISIFISIILHSIALLTFAYIRFNMDRNTQSSIPVTFVEGQKPAILQRQTPIRQIAYFSHAKYNIPKQAVYASLNYETPLETHVNLVRTVSDEFVIPEPNILQGIRPLHTDFQQPKNVSIAKPQIMPHWKQTKVKMTNPDGYKLISKGLLETTLEDKYFAVDIDTILQSFFGSVRKRIESHKRYPYFAKNAGIEGRSGVKITILRSGQLEKVEVVDSSGSEILDNAAMQSIREAAPFPPIPKDLGQNRIELSLYLVYKIAKT